VSFVVVHACRVGFNFGRLGMEVWKGLAWIYGWISGADNRGGGLL
jgi:hypothetical protein